MEPNVYRSESDSQLGFRMVSLSHHDIASGKTITGNQTVIKRVTNKDVKDPSQAKLLEPMDERTLSAIQKWEENKRANIAANNEFPLSNEQMVIAQTLAQNIENWQRERLGIVNGRKVNLALIKVIPPESSEQFGLGLAGGKNTSKEILICDGVEFPNFLNHELCHEQEGRSFVFMSTDTHNYYQPVANGYVTHGPGDLRELAKTNTITLTPDGVASRRGEAIYEATNTMMSKNTLGRLRDMRENSINYLDGYDLEYPESVLFMEFINRITAERLGIEHDDLMTEIFTRYHMTNAPILQIYTAAFKGVDGEHRIETLLSKLKAADDNNNINIRTEILKNFSRAGISTKVLWDLWRDYEAGRPLSIGGVTFTPKHRAKNRLD